MLQEITYFISGLEQEFIYNRKLHEIVKKNIKKHCITSNRTLIKLYFYVTRVTTIETC